LRASCSLRHLPALESRLHALLVELLAVEARLPEPVQVAELARLKAATLALQRTISRIPATLANLPAQLDQVGPTRGRRSMHPSPSSCTVHGRGAQQRWMQVETASHVDKIEAIVRAAQSVGAADEEEEAAEPLDATALLRCAAAVQECVAAIKVAE